MPLLNTESRGKSLLFLPNGLNFKLFLVIITGLLNRLNIVIFCNLVCEWIDSNHLGHIVLRCGEKYTFQSPIVNWTPYSVTFLSILLAASFLFTPLSSSAICTDAKISNYSWGDNTAFLSFPTHSGQHIDVVDRLPVNVDIFKDTQRQTTPGLDFYPGNNSCI